MKKFMSLVLALVMVMAMMVPAMAADGSITIENTVDGQTYSIYKIFDLESYNPESGAYAYKFNATDNAWAEFINGTGANYVTVDAQGYVTWNDGAKAADFATEALAYAESKGITATATQNADSTTVKFENLNLGYYLVDSSLGALCGLTTTDPDATIIEKNSKPTLDKEVQEDSNNSWGATNDADVNQVVNFKATIAVEGYVEKYVMHDTMSEGLTFGNVSSITLNGTEVANENNVNYAVVTETTDGCTFEVVFTDDFCESLKSGDVIVVYYNATLNEKAVVGDAGNPNEAKLSYSENNGVEKETTPDETITYTWDMNVVKFTKNGETEVKLAGATFKLSTDEAGENVLEFHALGNNKYEHCADTECDKEHVSEITTDESGTFNIEGLDAGVYYLTETAAPAGYNKLAAAIKVEIKPTEGENETLTYTTVEAKVENKAGTELPETGGMGTTMMYIGGGLLVAFAVIMLATKRRMNAAE